MRRPVLLSIAAFGLVVSAVSGSGLFAAVTSTVDSGPNAVTSKVQASGLEIATASNGTNGGPITCGTFGGTPTTPLITAAALEPGQGVPGFFCLRNTAGQSAALTVSAVNFSSVDTDCTGGEAAVDDTCGGGQSGELHSHLATFIEEADCATGEFVADFPPVDVDNPLVADLTSDPLSLGPIGPGAVRCFGAGAVYGTGPLATPPDSETIQLEQSDQVSWRYRFFATVA